jgi:hypothetical protein
MAPQGLLLSLSAAPIWENACPASLSDILGSHCMENGPNLEAKRKAPAVSAGLPSNAYRMAVRYTDPADAVNHR